MAQKAWAVADSAASRQQTIERHWLRPGPSVVLADEYAEVPVFDPVTGETHFLNDLPLMLLSEIGPQPRAFDPLLEGLGEDGDLDDHAKARIQGALLFLEQAGLIESRMIPAS